MSIPEVKTDAPEPRYTAAEWARINADNLCSQWGHELDHLCQQADGGVPELVSVHCVRCGRSWKVVSGGA